MDKDFNEELYKRYLKDNMMRMNLAVNKILFACIGAGPIVALGVFLRIFNGINYGSCIITTIAVSIVACVHYMLINEKANEELVKYMALVSFECIILFMSSSHMTISLTYFLVPLLSILYMDKKTYINCSIIGFVGNVLSLVMTSEYFGKLTIGYTPKGWFWDNFSSYAIQTVLMFPVGYFIVSFLSEFVVKSCEEKAINEAFKMERMTQEAIHNALSEKTPEASISTLLSKIGENFNCERAYIFEDYKNKNFTQNTYEWCAPGVSAEINNLKYVNREIIDWWYESFNRGENIIIRDANKLRQTNGDAYDMLRTQNVSRLITCPIIIQEKVIGFFGVDNPPYELMEDISGSLVLIGDILESLIKLRDSFEQLVDLSETDLMTGILNRGSGEKRIRKYVENGQTGVMYLLDADKFKHINDNYGHAMGDKVIISIAKALKSSFRNDDVVMRLGGDEFAAFAPGVSDADGVKMLTERLLKAIKDIKITGYDKEVCASIGIMVCNGEDLTYEDVYKHCDEALYESKKITGSYATYDNLPGDDNK